MEVDLSRFFKWSCRTYSLESFVDDHRNTFPRIIHVVGGNCPDLEKETLKVGQILILQEVQREQFVVLTQSSGTEHFIPCKSAVKVDLVPLDRLDEKYATVEELFVAQPDYFRVVDDIPSFGIKSGSVMKICSRQNGVYHMECEAVGKASRQEIVKLPLTLHGRFLPLHDAREYLLEEVLARYPPPSKVGVRLINSSSTRSLPFSLEVQLPWGSDLKVQRMLHDDTIIATALADKGKEVLLFPKTLGVNIVPAVDVSVKSEQLWSLDCLEQTKVLNSLCAYHAGSCRLRRYSIEDLTTLSLSEPYDMLPNLHEPAILQTTVCKGELEVEKNSADGVLTNLQTKQPCSGEPFYAVQSQERSTNTTVLQKNDTYDDALLAGPHAEPPQPGIDKIKTHTLRRPEPSYSARGTLALPLTTRSLSENDVSTSSIASAGDDNEYEEVLFGGPRAAPPQPKHSKTPVDNQIDFGLKSLSEVYPSRNLTSEENGKKNEGTHAPTPQPSGTRNMLPLPLGCKSLSESDLHGMLLRKSVSLQKFLKCKLQLKKKRQGRVGLDSLLKDCALELTDDNTSIFSNVPNAKLSLACQENPTESAEARMKVRSKSKPTQSRSESDLDRNTSSNEVDNKCDNVLSGGPNPVPRSPRLKKRKEHSLRRQAYSKRRATTNKQADHTNETRRTLRLPLAPKSLSESDLYKKLAHDQNPIPLPPRCQKDNGKAMPNPIPLPPRLHKQSHKPVCNSMPLPPRRHKPEPNPIPLPPRLNKLSDNMAASNPIPLPPRLHNGSKKIVSNPIPLPPRGKRPSAGSSVEMEKTAERQKELNVRSKSLTSLLDPECLSADKDEDGYSMISDNIRTGEPRINRGRPASYWYAYQHFWLHQRLPLKHKSDSYVNRPLLRPYHRKYSDSIADKMTKQSMKPEENNQEEGMSITQGNKSFFRKKSRSEGDVSRDSFSQMEVRDLEDDYYIELLADVKPDATYLETADAFPGAAELEGNSPGVNCKRVAMGVEGQESHEGRISSGGSQEEDSGEIGGYPYSYSYMHMNPFLCDGFVEGISTPMSDRASTQVGDHKEDTEKSTP